MFTLRSLRLVSCTTQLIMIVVKLPIFGARGGFHKGSPNLGLVLGNAKR